MLNASKNEYSKSLINTMHSQYINVEHTNLLTYIDRALGSVVPSLNDFTKVTSLRYFMIV